MKSNVSVTYKLVIRGQCNLSNLIIKNCRLIKLSRSFSTFQGAKSNSIQFNFCSLINLLIMLDHLVIMNVVLLFCPNRDAVPI